MSVSLFIQHHHAFKVSRRHYGSHDHDRTIRVIEAVNTTISWFPEITTDQTSIQMAVSDPIRQQAGISTASCEAFAVGMAMPRL